MKKKLTYLLASIAAFVSILAPSFGVVTVGAQGSTDDFIYSVKGSQVRLSLGATTPGTVYAEYTDGEGLKRVPIENGTVIRFAGGAPESVHDLRIIGELDYFTIGPQATDVKQWGTNKWKSFVGFMAGNKYITEFSAKDTPNLERVEQMNLAFYNSVFNGDLSNWSLTNVKSAARMFEESKFTNKSIENWDVRRIQNMNGMFKNIKGIPQFDLSRWETFSVTEMKEMFMNSKVSFNLYHWHITGEVPLDDMLTGTQLTIKQYDDFLSMLAHETGHIRTLGAGGLVYSDYKTREHLVSSNLTIKGDSGAYSALKILVTDELGEPVVGGEFRLMSEDGKIERRGFNAKGHILLENLPLGKYIIKQMESSPGDYAGFDEEVGVELKEHKKVETISILNPRLHGTFEILTKDEKGNTLNAGSYVIMNELEEVFGNITVAANGETVSNGLPYGTYFVKQITSAEGYVLDEEIKMIVVNEYRESDSLTFVNTKIVDPVKPEPKPTEPEKPKPTEPVDPVKPTNPINPKPEEQEKYIDSEPLLIEKQVNKKQETNLKSKEVKKTKENKQTSNALNESTLPKTSGEDDDTYLIVLTSAILTVLEIFAVCFYIRKRK